MTTAKLGHRTYNRWHYGVRFELGEPVLAIHAHTAIPTGYLQNSRFKPFTRNTRRRTIKIYAGIDTLAFAREPSAKAKKNKNDVTDTLGIEHTTSRARDKRVAPLALSAYENAVLKV